MWFNIGLLIEICFAKLSWKFTSRGKKNNTKQQKKKKNECSSQYWPLKMITLRYFNQLSKMSHLAWMTRIWKGRFRQCLFLKSRQVPSRKFQTQIWSAAVRDSLCYEFKFEYFLNWTRLKVNTIKLRNNLK